MEVLAVVIPTALTIGAGVWRLSSIISTLTNKVDNLADDVKEVKQSQSDHVRSHDYQTRR